MKTNNVYIKGIKNAARRMALGCLLLFASFGSLVAQNDSPFVIKNGDNYLAHVKVGDEWVLQNASTFNPATCLWYSGPDYNPTGYTHNYYFEDDAHNLRFLAAPLEPNGALSLSASLPSVSLLRNDEQVYYFYNWDPETYLSGIPEGGGVARGKRYYVSTEEECEACGHGATWYETNPETFQCWEVYWIENVGNAWKLSPTSSYNITSDAAHYRKVTITEHEKSIVSGGLTSMTVPTEMNYGDNSSLSAPVTSPYSYIPAYTNYVFLENGSASVHNYWGNTDHLTDIPEQQNNVTIGSKSYEWTISGDGIGYLSFASDSDVNTTTAETPTLYYRVPNNDGHKTATITVTVTYTDANDEQTIQTLSATVLVKTPCQNPTILPAAITYVDVTLSWRPTADSYEVSWKMDSDEEWNTLTVEDTTYILIGLQFDTEYYYKVKAECSSPSEEPQVHTFTTLKEPGLVVIGAIFGGGRMADVGGNTEVVVVNCDSIGDIYGGNDIAGEVRGDNGSKITLGVAANDPNNYDDNYGTTPNNGKIRVTSVYGGGNGYYAYNGTSFVPATENYTSETVEAGASVNAMTQSHTVGDVVWTNEGTTSEILEFPSIKKTAITVNDYVKVDSIFGGAKNAFLTTNNGDGSLITVNGGTVMAVFGGNNFGGDQGYGVHHIVVNGTTTDLALDIQNTATTGYGHDFGIRYLFGGGNKVYGSTTNIEIKGGQIDNVFGGGNSADVYKANVTVNCSLDAYSSNYTYGNTYTNAIQTYEDGVITPKPTGNADGEYDWNGKGIYNVRNLYGGNNMEHMASVPTIILTSGSVGTVYGGGNAGDMLASDDGTIDEDGDDAADMSFEYSTKVILNSDDIIVDYLYGGCRMSNVDYSTWVNIQDGHVGTVFGGCNVSGDVGSTRVNPSASGGAEYQEVQGGTYVEASGGTVYKNLFAGGNGFYHCNENFHYKSGIDYTDENYVGMLVPTHNETHAIVKTGATIKGNVYAGGNLAPVGFRDHVANYFPSFPVNAVGWAVVHVYGGTVEGNVFGGGNMADVYGSNDVMVAGGTIAAVYGGNDRTGQVGEFSNRVLPSEYSYATDGYTMLVSPGPEVRAYVRIVGNPTIQEVYGGGNGDYDYENGDEIVPEYCNANEQGPIQSNTFVDINIDGGSSGGHIGTVYGGGDGVTASGFIYVFMNINEPVTPEDHVNVDTVFGGNNKGNLEIVPNIILLKGHVGTVYGGCNEGAMTATGITVGGYENIGSYVHLRNLYAPIGNSSAPTATPDINISNAIYGGCRMNGVTNNSLVLVEGGNFSNIPIFGGSDISGTVSGTSLVAVNGETAIVGNVIGGGNGNYDYDGHNVYVAGSDHSDLNNLVATSDANVQKPHCVISGVDMISGTAANLYGGGNACGSDETVTNVEGGTVSTGIYGGSNASGTITGDVVVNIMGGNVGASGVGNAANIHGGGYGQATATEGHVTVNIGDASAATADGLPLIYGDVYGGSALGSINNEATDITTVNFLNGTLHGNVYGGGLGSATLDGYGYIDTSVPTIEAVVNGTVHVNIGDATLSANPSYVNFVNIDGKVFGGNNLAGTPKANVFVDVYRTAHDASNTCPDEVPNPFPNDASRYALSEVYGGGNLAHYVPTLEGAKTTVHVHNCDNTIHYVYGGGNAANVPEASVIIDGGLAEYLFGGGNGAGEGNPGANVTGNNSIELNGGMMAYVFGGSNTKGNIGGATTLSFAETLACTRSINELYGGGNQAPDSDGITLNVPCGTADVKTIFGGSKNADVGSAETPADIVLNIYGGDNALKAVYGGNNQGGTIYGNVTLNLHGGTMKDAFGGNNAGGSINGLIQVNVLENSSCPLKVDNVYGGGNEAAYAPTSATTSPEVNIIHGTVNNAVFGGGKGSTAIVTANPKVTIGDTNPSHIAIVGATLNDNTDEGLGYVFGGGDAAAVTGNTTVIYQDANASSHVKKIFGGGNNIGTGGVTGSHVQMTNGTVLEGIYGGCNTDGDVTGNSIVDIYGGTIGSTTAKANIHGGGYGQNTTVAGNVTVNFGQNGTTHNDALILYGDLYGGSALGSVNTNASNTTTVNVLTGIIQGTGNDPANDDYYGNVFGGGLGQKDPAIEAIVNGKVYVNIGTQDGGKASLARCNVYGCNNQNGSPQDDVYVDVWGTYHTEKDEVGYYGSDPSYAIYQVFGGGNQAHYLPEGSTSSLKKTHVTVHNCDNTIRYVYGGGNAANAVGVETIVLGGRFSEIYGGGNGRVTPADITGPNGIGINVVAGNVGFLFEGSNKEGTNQSGIYYKPDASSECLGGLFVDSYFFGTNEAELYGDLTNMITCADAGDFEYRYVYAGSRWGIVYGNINLMVCGGTIENLFGGCRGYENNSADVRRFPTAAEIAADEDGYYSDGVRAFLAAHPEYYGHGGNINLVITGGTIGNVFGGCDIKGNVEGKITVTVSEREGSACPLFVGNVYGASNQWYHTPEHDNIISPDVSIIRGTIGGTHPDLPVNNIYGVPATAYEGNVFGGGNHGNVTANPRVIVGDSPDAKVTIKGNVYGGGNEGNITGSPKVIVIPEMHSFSYSHGDGGTIVVKDGQDQDVSSSDQIGEGISLSIMATPQNYAHTFSGWTVTGTGASIAEPSAASTTFTMGTTDASISASFEAAASAPALTLTTPSDGTFTVTGPHGIVTGTTSVATGTVFTISATPDVTHRFSNWSVSGTGSTIANSTSATTTFTMGSGATTLTAVFGNADINSFTYAISGGNGSVTVTDRSDNTVSSGANIGEGAVLNIVATAFSGYAFSHWTVDGAGSSVANTNNPSTTFTMGTDNATLTANFVTTHTLNITEPSNGTVRVTNSLGQVVDSGDGIGEGAKLNLKATPASGYAFKQWTIDGAGSSVEGDDVNRPTTTFTMGTAEASISATFIPAHLLTVEEPVHGTVEITSPLGQNMSNPASIGENVEVTIKATPADGYTFGGWQIVGDGDGEIGNISSATTKFTMRTQNTTIRAIFN